MKLARQKKNSTDPNASKMRSLDLKEPGTNI